MSDSLGDCRVSTRSSSAVAHPVGHWPIARLFKFDERFYRLRRERSMP